MSGTTVIGVLLAASAELVAIVPADRMKAGELPEETDLPAIVVSSVSLIDRQPLRRGPTVRSAERVAVTVRATSYEERELVFGLIRRACAGAIGTIGGVLRASVLTAGAGPELRGPNDSFERTQDFRVSYDA